MALPVSFSFTDTPSFFSGTGTSVLVPEVFPVAINGRPYMVDVKSQQFTRQFDQRVRDSQDNSTAPGEAAINPQGLWRRGQNSWHFGAGQQYADVAASQDFRFYKSKGINPWTKGELTLLNSTVLRSQSTFAGTNLPMVEVNGYLYVGDGATLKYTTDPFASTPTWVTVTGGPAGASINDLTTDGSHVFIAYNGKSIYRTTIGGATVSAHYPNNSDINYTRVGFAKGFVLGYHPDTANGHIHVVPLAPANKGTPAATVRDPNFISVGFAGGQNHIYMAGRSTDNGLVYRMGIKADATTIDAAIVALELPVGEYPTSIYGYLGGIFLGTNRGVRYATADNNGNLIAGALIPTTGDVNGFTAEDRFVWFGWSNYDGTSGLGRLDLSVFTSPNTPAFATDLMYGSTNAVKSVVSLNGKRVFSISGVGVIVEDTANLVESGEFETGIHQWGIPDDKFAPRVDVRCEPLQGTISAAVAVENQAYVSIGEFNLQNQTRHTYIAPENKFIEAGYKFTIARLSTNIGPRFTRWMSRAYAAPARSRIISVPILLHERFTINNKDYYFDVALERDLLEELTASPRIVTYQEKDDTFSVIIEDARWQPVLVSGTDWLWEGTMTVIMRTITE